MRRGMWIVMLLLTFVVAWYTFHSRVWTNLSVLPALWVH